MDFALKDIPSAAVIFREYEESILDRKYDVNIDASIRYRFIVDTFKTYFCKTIKYLFNISNLCYIIVTLVSIFRIK